MGAIKITFMAMFLALAGEASAKQKPQQAYLQGLNVKMTKTRVNII